MNRLPDSYFEKVYEDELDPWRFTSRWYEERKRACTLAALPKRTYRRAFEPGCAIGVLTQDLAARCDEVVAWDVHADAVAECQRRCAAASHVRATVGVVPDDWPTGSFDLIVLSEVAYYLDAQGLDALVDHITSSLDPDGTVIAVHWLGQTDYLLTGDATHRLLAAKLAWSHTVHHIDSEFVLDVWQRR